MKEKGLFGRVSHFFAEVKHEGKRVVWPSRKETLLTTAFVFFFAVIMSTYFAFVDMVIFNLLNLVMA